MAAARHTSPGAPPLTAPLDRLAKEPYRFDFFQAVRLLTWAAHQAGQGGEPPAGRSAGHSVGHDSSPADEAVRFRSLPSLSFPAAAIDQLDWPAPDRQGVPRMQVTFLGLFGQMGVLPRHYTQLIIDRSRHKDTSLRDFLDLFNHRVISLFWRAWAKHRLPIAYELSQLGEPAAGEDLFTRTLYSLVGLGHRGLRDRQAVADAAFLYFAGHFAQTRPQAVTLEAIVSEYFSVAACVLQFQGQWLQLQRADQSRLASPRPGFADRQPANNRLGKDVVVGERVWSVENRFRLRLGPLSYRQFEAFTPAGPLQIPLAQLVRSYVGAEYDFDVQLVLRREEVPLAQLAARGQPARTRLGWNSWVYNQPFSRDADDAAFTCDGQPTRG